MATYKLGISVIEKAVVDLHKISCIALSQRPKKLITWLNESFDGMMKKNARNAAMIR